MNGNNSKQSYPIFNNTLREHKSIIEGYEKKKYLNKNYTSKSKRNIKTRDGNKCSKYNTKKQSCYKENNGDLINSIEDNTNSVKNLTSSIENRYCSIPNNKINDIVEEILDKKIEDEWIVC
tara:strand:+ start:1086 stop:1448 length:363 start_codon:yes stop_codon:yes gene_type:complete